MTTNRNAGAKARAKSANARKTQRKSPRRKILRVGIYGLGANPVTTSHKIIAEQAADQANLDITYWVPVGQPTDKKVESKTLRAKFIRRTVKNNPRFKASWVEFRRKGWSYMADTLRYFKRLHPHAELFLIVGEDRVSNPQDPKAELKNWHEAHAIFEMATILCGPRYGCQERVTDEWLASMLPPGARSQAIEIGYSSTWIRKRMSEGRSVRYMIDDGDIEDIKAHGAYGTAKAATGNARRSK